jgi:uncharacterized protein YjbI with pentapeptide repeats
MKSTNRSTYYNSQATTSEHKRELLQRLKSFKTPADELLKQYASGERDFCGVNISEHIFTGVNLSGADFSEATLHRTVLEEANLMKANLSKADLTGANLRRADLSRANLVKANLRGANLRGADLSGADLSGADLSGADLGGAILPDGSILLTSQLSNRVISPYAKAHS